MPRLNNWGESLQDTIARSRAQRGLLVSSLCKGEVIRVAISGATPEAVKIDQDRTITARALGTKVGSLEIITDTATEDNWTARTVCLGSYAFSIMGVEFAAPGLLRGMISQNSGVAVDLTAQHFVGNEPSSYLMAEYKTLLVEDELIF